MATVKKERWASRLGLVLAMAGNAVGLGNFLRFPAQAVKNGGGAFLIPYLVALLVMGLPLIWVEWTMGRYGGKHGHHSTPGIFDVMGKSPIWRYLGVFGLWVNLIIAAYYLYIESWTMAYAGKFAINGFAGFSDEQFGQFFDNLTGSREGHVIAISVWGLSIFFVCMALNVFILSRGLAKGIELVAKVGMPLLIVFAAILAVRGLFLTPGVDDKVIASPIEGLSYLWTPKFDSLYNPAVWLAAAGQIFFTLSIGMGSIQCYASYVREKDDITLTGATAAWTNEFCEVILGGSILIPIAFAYLGEAGLKATIENSSGLGLGFVVFPRMFQHWQMLSAPAGFLWFGLLFFAAITSSLAMGQPIMAFLQTEFNFSREKSALAFGGMLLPLTVPVAIFHMDSFFSEFDYWGGTFALVIFATIESVLFAWVFGMDKGWEEMMKGGELRVPSFFYGIMKYVTPVFLIVVLVAYVFQPTIGWDGCVKSLVAGKIPAWEFDGGSMVGQIMLKDLHDEEAKLNGQLAELTGAKKSSEESKEKENASKIEKINNRLAILPSLRILRSVDRLVMLATFALFGWLVSIAWKRREGAKK